MVQTIVKILKPLESVTKIMSGQKYVTASSIIILTEGLHGVYSEMKNDNNFYELSKVIVETILNGIKQDLEIWKIRICNWRTVHQSIWKRFDEKKVVALLSGTTGTPQLKSIIEVQRYLEEPLISRDKDPVGW
ncbi:hypothetical protein NQ315_003248 [Exocentrus adspersus]|uniref:Uncharacterized protein n=1 Tax=Exocentrus adspersus TaxID=1586481 RepID=A0AAV8VNW9_9CUCU|nr:hypothetical protein NQ315_003248 [Exocentrus adspersus]